MEPRGDQPQRPDGESTPQRPIGYNPPIQRRPPLSRGFDAQPMARRSFVPGSSSLTPSSTSPAHTDQSPAQEVFTPAESTTPYTPTDHQSNVAQEPAERVPQATTPNPPAEPREYSQVQEQITPQIAVAQPRDFTPPAQKPDRRRWLYPAIAVVAVLALGAGVFGYTKALAARNNPHNVMQNALDSSLSLSTVQSTTKSSSTTATTQYDFTAKQPTTSTEVSLTTPKGQTSVKGYGDLKNTYINYASLPKTVSPNIAKQMSTAWVQVRQDGALPKALPDLVFKISDPRYQAFGPVIMGNFEGKTKEELRSFITKNKVYSYDETKVTKDTLGEESVFVFPIKLDVSYLKVASQSVAVSMGLEPSETQLAVDSMESLRDANIALYIRTSDHTIARMSISKDGSTTTIDLSGYKTTKLPDAPQTKLLWQGFVPLQNQIENQASLTKSSY